MSTSLTPSEPRTDPPARHARRPTRPRVRPLAGSTHVVLIGWSLVVTLPLLWAVISSLKTADEIFTSPWSVPDKPQFDNYARAWNEASIGQYFLNSLIVVTSAVVLVMLLGSMTAYVLARYPFRGSQVIYYLFVAGMAFPVFLALIPLFFVVKGMGLLNTDLGLILVYAAYSLPFTVFFMTAFFRTLPSELAEAAVIDGCGHFRVFFQIMLPLATPGLIGVGIFNFLGLWNQYLLPLALNQDPDNYVLAQGLAMLAINQGYSSDWGALFAGLSIAMLPVIMVYVIFHRRIQSGITAGAVK
ncbi:carbohydrate ABC transporter permease [Streptomyces sp. NBC_00887]|uniref:carbohydrate ABC transporter permease n=1 Tax=Streptomyces sp. NBC_00887 TaxID=2975859 RepID=UPI00386A8496|nr:carbohydrate ABC transporter permease [Streptomyces sp. NBC_00887]WSY36280.1 carbohydrate ABC transporter permease [Streptomyces sp. NBC_00887]